MTSLYETALNGMMVGQKASDLDQMYADRKAAGAHLEAALLLKIGVEMEDIQSAERQANSAYRNLRQVGDQFNENPSVSNAEWLTHYANEVAKFAARAHAAYGKVGELWSLWKLTQA